MTVALQNSVPTLRFKDERGQDYPDWVEKNLGDIAKIHRGSGLSKSAIHPSGKIPCILYGELFTKYKETISQVHSFTDDRTRAVGKYGDILMPTSDVTPDGLATASALLVEGVQLGGDINIIRLDKGNHTDHPVFMSYLINSCKKKVMRLVTGTTVKHIYPKDIQGLRITIPRSLEEQQKIAAFLSAIDTRIEQLNRNKSLLGQYKQGMMQKLFSQEIRFKDDAGKDYPDWEEKRLRKIAKIHRGSGLSKSAIHPSGKIPCILYGELFTKYKETISQVHSFTDDRTRAVGKYGDILMPTSDVTPDGLATASALLVEGVQLGGDINIIRLDKGDHPVFMSYLINSCKQQIMRLVTGTTVKHIYPKDIQGVRITIPRSLEEQQKIAEFLSAIDRKIEFVTSQLEHAQSFKKGLLQQMFI